MDFPPEEQHRRQVLIQLGLIYDAATQLNATYGKKALPLERKMVTVTIVPIVNVGNALTNLRNNMFESRPKYMARLQDLIVALQEDVIYITKLQLPAYKRAAGRENLG